MSTLQALLREWAFFAGMAVFIAGAALAGALLIARRGERRLSSQSRYTLVGIALLVPLVVAMLVPAAAGAWEGLLAWRATAVPPAQGVVASDIDLAGVATAAPALDALSLAALFWALVFLFVAATRLAEWFRWTRVGRRAANCDDSRLIVAFNRAWRGNAAPPTVRMSVSCEEPMVVGLLDPVVLLPVGYGEGLTDTEIEAVAVHELEHVLRRDNLDAAIADFLTSVFWFDPFHWIARARLLELREGACDERVLASGLPARAYLSALAKTSHAAIATPAVACMSGFRVRERMESIMSYPNNRPRWIPERSVRAGALAALALAALAIAGFAPAAADGDATPGKHSVTVVMTPLENGQILVDAEARTPEGTPVSRPRVVADVGTPIEVISKSGGRTYKLSVTPAADGSGFARLEVLEGEDVVDTVVKSIEAPALKLRKPATKVTAHFDSVDVREFARVMSGRVEVPIVVANAAAGKVTIHETDIPWDQAVAQAVAPLGLQLAFRNGQALIVPASSTVTLPRDFIPGPLGEPIPLPPPPPGYERIGGDITPPKVITRVDPRYPEEARKERVSGLVVVEAMIGEDGLVRDVKVRKGLPFGMDEAAVDAVRQWTFQPATKDGKPVAVVFNLTINFKLDGGEKAEP
jgi:TonB family protein